MSDVAARMALLRAEVERDWASIVARAHEIASVDPGASPPEAALVALALHHAYQAFETLLLRIEEALGLPPRTGTEWHADLLRAATLEIPGLRPAIVPDRTHDRWRALLGFRHFLRHAYTARLDPEALDRNRAHLARAIEETAPALEALLSHLVPTPGSA